MDPELFVDFGEGWVVEDEHSIERNLKKTQLVDIITESIGPREKYQRLVTVEWTISCGTGKIDEEIGEQVDGGGDIQREEVPETTSMRF